MEMDDRVARVLVVLIAHVIFLSGFFLRLRRGHREPMLRAEAPWWVRWAPPLVWIPWVVALFVDAGHFSVELPARLLGLAVALGGAVFAAWGIWTLGAHYAIGLDLIAGHQVVTRGPYAVVRHPTYLGAIVYHVGAALALGDLLLLALTAVVVLPYLTYRLALEERVLMRGLGEQYASYARRVPPLLPWPRT